MNKNTNNIQKISRVLLYPVKNLVIKIHVKLVNENGGERDSFHNIYKTNTGLEFLTLDIQTFLTIEIKDGEWSKDKTILVTQKNIRQIVKGFKKCIKMIYNNNIFAVNKQGDIIMYNDKKEESIVRIFNIGNNNRIILEPCVIYDIEDDLTYEGVIMYINKKSNYIELPIQALEAMYQTLKDVNFFIYSQLLINYYLISANKIEPKTKEMTNYNKDKLIKWTDREMGIVEGNYTKQLTANEFFGINQK